MLVSQRIQKLFKKKYKFFFNYIQILVTLQAILENIFMGNFCLIFFNMPHFSERSLFIVFVDVFLCNISKDCCKIFCNNNFGIDLRILRESGNLLFYFLNAFLLFFFL